MLYGEDRQGGATESKEKPDSLDCETQPVIKSKAKPNEICERTKRIEEIRTTLPGCTFAFASIDTENAFDHDGKTYRIDSSVEAYQPKATADGLLYDMDRVVVVVHDGEHHFYTQDYFLIERECVHQITG